MNWPPIAELVLEIKSKRRSATDLVAECLSRLENNTELHTTLEIYPEAATKAARAIDELADLSQDPRPLLGIPYLIKDNILTLLGHTTAASSMLETYRSQYQATVVEKLTAAGAILLGKTNLDEFAHGSTTENSAFGPTLNPVDNLRVPGGSSGGSAAAVAALITPFAIGTDTGGSIRQPASFCGVVGYKPTYGLVSRYGVLAMASSTDVVGPLATSVKDAAQVLDVIAGHDRRDGTTIACEESYQPHSVELNKLKIGIIKEHVTDEVDAGVMAIIQAKIDNLTQAGAEICEISLPVNELAVAAYYVLVPAEISSNLARYDGVKYGTKSVNSSSLAETYLNSRGEGFGPETLRRILTGTYVLSSGYQEAYYHQAQRVRTLIRQEYETALTEVDVLIGPTTPTLPFMLGSELSPLELYLADIMTIPANLAGLPAISIPIGESEGLPVGLQLMGRQGQDHALLSIAAAIEDMT